MKAILKLLFLIMPAAVFAQSLSPTVISSSGGYYASANTSLSFTVAEMTMVQTFSSSSNILTQGFQQPEDMVVNIPETPGSTEDMMIFPNPTNGQFNLTFSSNSIENNIIKLYDLLGQVVLTKDVSQLTGMNTVSFDISNLSQGIYMIQLITMNAQGERQTNISKINLIY